MAETGVRKRGKREVNYSPRYAGGRSEYCMRCRHWIGRVEPAAVGECERVHGKIAAMGSCDLWERKEAPKSALTVVLPTTSEMERGE